LPSAVAAVSRASPGLFMCHFSPVKIRSR
jgi:hypothetical protein